MEEPVSMGRYIRESRLKQGLSLGQLAANIGRSSSSVRRWERDEVAPAITIMPSLAGALNVDVRELELRRPIIEDSDDTGSHTAGGEQIRSTMEQLIVEPDAHPMTADPSRRSVPLGLFGDMWNTVFAQKTSWIGWVRGISTAVILIIMIVILFWALGELMSALGQVWDSFGTGASST